MLLRYPGGKSRGPLCKRIVDLVGTKYEGGLFSEPFFGGGGITFRLLKDGMVDRVLINDLDRPLANLWNLAIYRPSHLCRLINLFRPSVESFLSCKKAILDEMPYDLGFEMLVVNRLSHAGRGVKAGPQGGLKQSGKYKIDCRWNPTTLVNNVWKVHNLFLPLESGGCQNASYEEFLTQPVGLHYLDPPYWEVGEELYPQAFTEEQHTELRDRLIKCPNWILSYNNHPAIRELYKGFNMETLGTSGNGGEKAKSELLIWN